MKNKKLKNKDIVTQQQIFVLYKSKNRMKNKRTKLM
jgi:hypothetical protein